MDVILTVTFLHHHQIQICLVQLYFEPWVFILSKLKFHLCSYCILCLPQVGGSVLIKESALHCLSVITSSEEDPVNKHRAEERRILILLLRMQIISCVDPHCGNTAGEMIIQSQ